jgi:hypothetical protein
MNESLFPIVLNSSNAINSNTFRYKFARGSQRFKGAKIALSTINMYYSWQNIKASYRNNRMRIDHPFGDSGTGTGVKTIDITMPDGNYEISDINKYIQFRLVEEKCYLINDKGQYVYYIELITNPTQYKVQLNLLDVPTSLPSGWTNPDNGFEFPTASGASPEFFVYDEFSKVIGMNVGSYFESRISDFTPQVSPVSSILIGCSLVSNHFTNPSTIIYSFVSGGTKYGSILSINAQDLVYSNIRDGTYHEFDITFMDQNFKPLDIIDTSLIIYLVVKVYE